MAQQRETIRIACRRCGMENAEHESAYDAIRSGWRLRRVGDAMTKDYLWLCVACAQSERPPGTTVDAGTPRAPTRRPG